MFGLVPFHLEGPVQVRLFGMNGHTEGLFETEMESMHMTGSVTVAGVGTFPVEIRESPTLASLGETHIMAVTDGVGSFAIDSFFDVFTEMSITGITPGFVPAANGPNTVALIPEPGSWTLAALVLTMGVAMIRRKAR
ncbi:MAG: hypothetical protein WD176_07150, partial [Pirellulales bacterium]